MLAAKLRPANIDASAGALEEVQRIVARVRERWPKVKILLRADSGFTRDELMAWCGANRVDYVFGLAGNQRLVAKIEGELAETAGECARTCQPARRFREFFYATRDSWSRRRWVVAKAEHLAKGANPRFVVTSLKSAKVDMQTLYERIYCARGEMENRIKGKERQWRQWRRVSATNQLDFFADRTSTATMKANQLRLWFASFAYVMVAALRRLGLQHTQFADATSGTIRLKLLKIGAQVRISVRRLKIAMASAYPWQLEWALAHARLSAAAA